jgi:hypothetical protein
MRGTACLLLGAGLLAGGLGGLGGLGELWGTAAGAEDKDKGVVVKLGDLQSRSPADWVEEKPTSNLRLKQFKLPAVKEDKENAAVVIFFFGQGQGGTAKENIKRWKDQIVPPEGKTIDDVTEVEELKIGGAKATYFNSHGTYKFKARPADTEVTLKPKYRLINVMLDNEQGPYFIRLVGPEDTVEHYKKGFDKWVKGFKAD